jgi:hypothetical protein
MRREVYLIEEELLARSASACSSQNRMSISRYIVVAVATCYTGITNVGTPKK